MITTLAIIVAVAMTDVIASLISLALGLIGGAARVIELGVSSALAMYKNRKKD